MVRTLRKIELKKEDLILGWKQHEDEEGSPIYKIEIVAPETPNDDFMKAMSRMRRHLVSFCELPNEDNGIVTLTKVEIDRTPESVSVTLHGVRKVESAKGKLKLDSAKFTYNLEEDAPSEGSKKNVMPEKCFKDLELLEAAALAWLEGKRDQLKLDFSDAKTA